MAKFRKKPVVIEAFQLDDHMLNADEIISWAHDGLHPLSNSIITRDFGFLRIRTLEDKENSYHYASPGDWIIKGVKGEFYACKPDIFWQTYERAE